MKLTIKHYGRVVEGRVEYYNYHLYKDQISALNGKEFVMEFKEKHIKPSTDQHGYYRGGILITCHKTEMFSHCDKKDDIHDDYFAPKFLGYVKVVTIGGKASEQFKVRSLSDLDKEEMTEFISRVIADCEMNGIKIPSPEEYYNKYYQR